MSANSEQIARILESMKGVSGSGNALGEMVEKMSSFILTMEPGDYAQDNPRRTITAPVAYDLWYLFGHDNFMSHYYAEVNQDLKDYQPYLDDCFDFLKLLPGLKPLRVLRNLEQFVGEQIEDLPFWEPLRFQWTNNGIYWVNTAAFELWLKDLGMQYTSDGPKNFKPNDYVGYLSFPVGQLGVMEVISLIQETKIAGYTFAGCESPSSSGYEPKLPVVLEDKDKPSLQSTPEMFPDMKDAGQNYCYGKHLIESAYLVPEEAAQEPAVNRDVELLSSPMEKYIEDVKPKFWMRYWIHKESTLPVPGEFIGILCRPVACPPHVWWFQESSPFLYAGNWMETGNLTSGKVLEVKKEADRPAGSIGDEYLVLIQGCMVTIYPTDFFTYEVGERVAILKLDSTATKAEKSFTWLDQVTFKDTDENTVKEKYIIIPATFYIKK